MFYISLVRSQKANTNLFIACNCTCSSLCDRRTDTTAQKQQDPKSNKPAQNFRQQPAQTITTQTNPSFYLIERPITAVGIEAGQSLCNANSRKKNHCNTEKLSRPVAGHLKSAHPFISTNFTSLCCLVCCPVCCPCIWGSMLLSYVDGHNIVCRQRSSGPFYTYSTTYPITSGRWSNDGRLYVFRVPYVTLIPPQIQIHTRTEKQTHTHTQLNTNRRKKTSDKTSNTETRASAQNPQREDVLGSCGHQECRSVELLQYKRQPTPTRKPNTISSSSG